MKGNSVFYWFMAGLLDARQRCLGWYFNNNSVLE
jgi:hypothetical protein